MSLALLRLYFISPFNHNATTRSRELTNTTLLTQLQASFTAHQLCGKCPLPVPKSCPGTCIAFSDSFSLGTSHWLFLGLILCSRDTFQREHTHWWLGRMPFNLHVLMCFHDCDEVMQEYHRKKLSLFWWHPSQGYVLLCVLLLIFLNLIALVYWRLLVSPQHSYCLYLCTS